MRPTLVMTVRPFDFAQRVAQQQRGVAIATMPDRRWGRCDLKTTGLLANVLAKQAARAAGAFEAWLVGPDGTVAEGGSTNAWIVAADGTLVTPPLTPRVLPGVMRGGGDRGGARPADRVEERASPSPRRAPRRKR